MRGGHQPALSDIELCVSFMEEIRAAIGNRADLLLGTHGQFTTSGAIRLGQAIERLIHCGLKNLFHPIIYWSFKN